jgi:hypothetical protein
VTAAANADGTAPVGLERLVHTVTSDDPAYNNLLVPPVLVAVGLNGIGTLPPPQEVGPPTVPPGLPPPNLVGPPVGVIPLPVVGAPDALQTSAPVSTPLSTASTTHTGSKPSGTVGHTTGTGTSPHVTGTTPKTHHRKARKKPRHGKN